MRKMLLSFKPEVYEKIKSGKKKFEHRRNFPDEPIMAYMYVSAPIKAIKGMGNFRQQKETGYYSRPLRRKVSMKSVHCM